MKCTKEVKKVIEGTKLRIEGMHIGDETYSMNIDDSHEGKLLLDFDKSILPDDGYDYRIIIEKEGVRFVRYIIMSGHDHNDTENLQVIAEKTDMKDYGGTVALTWQNGLPDEDKYEYFYVPFGKKVIDW